MMTLSFLGEIFVLNSLFDKFPLEKLRASARSCSQFPFTWGIAVIWFVYDSLRYRQKVKNHRHSPCKVKAAQK
jgi:hypothetical protein